MENEWASMKHGAGTCSNLGESTLVRCYQSNVITWNDSIWEVDRGMQIGKHTSLDSYQSLWEPLFIDARLSSKTMTPLTFSLAMSQAGTYVISASGEEREVKTHRRDWVGGNLASRGQVSIGTLCGWIISSVLRAAQMYFAISLYFFLKN